LSYCAVLYEFGCDLQGKCGCSRSENSAEGATVQVSSNAACI
jgi:hypothetical protein